MTFTPRTWQTFSRDWLLNRLYTERVSAGGLFVDPGLGKTAITLMALQDLKALGEVKRALVVAPLPVCYSVWPLQIAEHGFPLTWSLVHGTPKQRLKALHAPADVHLINREGLPWLCKQQFEPFDFFAADESTSFKSWKAQRSKAARWLAPKIRFRSILTGTPSPNSYADLHGQIYLLDGGETLGKTATYFRSQFMHRGGFQGREWIVNEGVDKEIEKAIAPLVLRLDAADHLDLPPLIKNKVWVDLPPEIARAYKQIERELFAALDSGEQLTASGAGAKYVLCRGVANGGAYVGEKDCRTAVHVHDAKLERVADLVDELGGKPVMVAYQFDHDLARLRRKFKDPKKYPVIKGRGCKPGGEPGPTPAEVASIIDRWNAGKIHVLLVQPQSLSHGANMQKGPGRDIIWFGPCDSLEIDDQFNRRIFRQGVTGQVRVHYVLARGTVDTAIITRLEDKGERQKKLLDTLNTYRHGRLSLNNEWSLAA
jgi:hypothetical protein